MHKGIHEQEHSRGFMDSSPPNKVPSAIDCESIFKRLPLLDFDGAQACIKQKNPSNA
jgi:hypothetical protein